MKTYNDVRREFEKYKELGGELDLSGYAQASDADEGAPTRQVAYNDTWYKKLDALIDRGFEATHLPEASGYVGKQIGRGFDSLLGTQVEPVVEAVGEHVPRMVAESLLTLPAMASVAGAPAAAATWANRARKLGQAVGYGSAATRGYAETESPVGAAIGAGQMFAANKLLLPASRGGMNIGGRAEVEALKRMEGVPSEATSTAQRVLGPLIRTGTDVGATTALNEATRQAMMSFGPNAVGPLDPARNPFTEENIAANVAGSVFFTPQLVEGLRNPIRIQPRHAEQRLREMTARDTAELEVIETAFTPDPTEAAVDPELRSRHEALYGIVRNSLQSAKQLEFDGDIETATRLRQNALATIDEAAAGRFSPFPDDLKEKVKDALGTESRSAQDLRPEWLDGFVDKVRDTVDSFSVEHQRYLDERAVREESLNWADKAAVKKHESWVATQEAQRGKTWHEGARSKDVVTRLWSNGKLPPLTPEWVQAELQKKIDQGFSQASALQIVGQEAANYLSDRLPSAIEADRLTSKADTPVSKGVSKLNDDEAAFIRALTSLPEAIQDAAIHRTVEMKKHSNFTPSEAERMGVSEGVRFDRRSGRPVTPYPNWQRAVIAAAETFDPETRTVQIGGKTIPYTQLVAKDPATGRYLWNPPETHVPMSAGGKPVSVKQVYRAFPDETAAQKFVQENGLKAKPTFENGQWLVRYTRTELKESNIEALPTKTSQEGVGAFDEEAAKATLAEQGMTGDIASDEGRAATRATEDKLGLPVTKAEQDVSSSMAARADHIRKNLTSLTDEQLATLAKDEFKLGHGVTMEKKTPQLRQMLEDVLSGEAFKPARMREARVFFQFQTPARGKFKGKLPTKMQENHVIRATNILDKLADDKMVARAKTSAFPKMAGDDSVSSDDFPGTLTNRPATEGQFAQDFTRTFKTWVDAHLGREGYSGTTREFLVEMGMALARQSPDMAAKMDFYRMTGGAEGMAFAPRKETGDRPAIGLNLDKPVGGVGMDARAQAVRILQTLTHEIVHMDGYIRGGLLAEPDAYSNERRRTLYNMEHLLENLTPDERAAMLTQVREYVPEELQTLRRDPDGRPYGTSNPEEALSELVGHVVNMLFFDTPRGRMAAQEMLDMAPQEFREFARNTFLTVHDITKAMRDAIHEPAVRADAGKESFIRAGVDPFILEKGFDALVASARTFSELRYVDKALADSRTFLATADGRPEPGMTSAMFFQKSQTPYKNQATMPEATSQTSMDAFKMAADYLGPHQADAKSKPNLVMSLLAPFRAKMLAFERDGNPVALPIADAIFGLESGTNRLVSSLLSPFMKRKPDGSIKLDQDAPLIRRIQKEPHGRWRDDGVNKISAWQQKVHELADGRKADRQQMFVRDPKTGQIMVNSNVKNAQAAWDTIRSQFSREDQDFIMQTSVILDEIGQDMRDKALVSYRQTNTNILTAAVMAMNRKMGTLQAKQVAEQVHNAFLSGQQLKLGAVIPAEHLDAYHDLLMGADGKGGLIGTFRETEANLLAGPGYRSESLPHDWIVRYRDKKGNVKFDSRPEESQAQALAKRLQDAGNTIEGEIINKRDAKEFSSLEDPDGLLIKASEKAGFVWDKFVKDMETKHGTQVGADLRAGYMPLESTIRERGQEGLARSLATRKGYVDRKTFDYVDSTLASAQRLGRAIAVKSMTQDVLLWLNDPTVRLQTSFKNLVTGHMTEMLKAQSPVLQQMKGLTSGYFIGANLSSVVLNAMQSLQTLVPYLDMLNKGGTFYEPWVQLGRAIGDATDMTLTDSWHADAARAKTKRDPSKWTEAETVAALWQRQNEVGGFSHTVIDDLVYGTDQRLLTNAKFGRGDYGPTTKASMLRSGLYLLNQFAMKPFRWVEHGNAKVAFLAGVRQAYKQGLRGDAAYSHASKVQGLATFGGGRANVGGLHTTLSRGFGPGGAGLALALQQYAFGVVGMHAQFVKDAIQGSKTLSPAEKWRMRRAYGTMLMTQTALAGTLGLPLVGAVLTALEKVFGIPANQAVRDGLASLSDDDETGATIAEIGLNGFADYYTGLDVSSRVGVSTLLGTSSYRGFSWGDLMGPVGGILENGIRSLNYFSQNEPLLAASALAPQALKNAILQTDTRHKYGDSGFRDAGGNLIYQPTETEATAYKFGARPRGLSRRRQAAQATVVADGIVGRETDRQLDRAARSLVAGDPTDARRIAVERQAVDPTMRYQEVLRQVMDRAVGQTVEKDLLASGSRLNEAERERIVKTFGEDVNTRRSEVDLQKLRFQMAQLLGDPSVAPQMADFERAAMVDALVAGGTMPRSKAIRLVEFLSR